MRDCEQLILDAIGFLEGVHFYGPSLVDIANYLEENTGNLLHPETIERCLGVLVEEGEVYEIEAPFPLGVTLTSHIPFYRYRLPTHMTRLIQKALDKA